MLRTREASQNYVNRMWENLLLAFIGEVAREGDRGRGQGGGLKSETL